MPIENSTYHIDSIDDLIHTAIHGIPENITKLTISPEISTIHIHVSGEGYGASIPGEQLRTLWELQENLYRLAAFAIHGSSDIRSLGDLRHQFEVTITVDEGSWVTDIATGEFFTALFENTFGKMTGTEIAWTICLCALLIAGYLAWDSRNKRIEAIEKEKTTQKMGENLVDVVNSFNRSHSTFSEQCVAHTSVSIENTAEKLAKRGSGISSMEVAGRSYGTKEIESLRARAKSEPDRSDNLCGDFYILAVDKGILPWSIKLRSDIDNSELLVKLAPDAIDGDGEQARNDVLTAFSEDLLVNCEITIGKKRNLINSIAIASRSSDQ